MLKYMKYIFACGVLICVGVGVTLSVRRRMKRGIKKQSIIDLIGNTPLLYLKSLSELTGKEIYGKAEFMNPGGSMKDRTALALIRRGEREKRLKNGWIYEGTSGSTGISLGCIGNVLGYRTKVFLPDDLTQEKYDQLRMLNVEMVKVRPVSIVDSKHYCRIAEEEAQRDGAYFTDQFNNLANMEIHEQVTAEEIWRQTNGQVDCFVMSAGTGGAIAGISRGLKRRNPNLKVVLVDPPGSSLKNRVNLKVCYTDEEAEGHRVKHPYDTVVEGVGQNRLTRNFEMGQIDYAFRVEDKESYAMAIDLLQKEGLFVGGSSTMNCVEILKAIHKYPQCKVFVTILCDQGLRYLTKFYSPNNWNTTSS